MLKELVETAVDNWFNEQEVQEMAEEVIEKKIEEIVKGILDA